MIVFDQSNKPVVISTDAHQEFLKTLNLAMSELSEKSRRQYASTLNSWREYCIYEDISLIQFDPHNIKRFITEDDWRNEQSWSNNTRKAKMSHMRKFLDALYAAAPENSLFARWHTQGTRFLTNKNLGGDTNVRQATPLTDMQVKLALSRFDLSTYRGLRDKAIFVLLFFYGLRRFEVAKLEWKQINFTNGQIFIEQGKGRADASDADIVPTLSIEALQILQDWQDALFEESGNRLFCFPRINKGDNIGKDEAIHPRSVNKIIKRVSDETGIDFRSHDGRRTIITHLINSGARLQDVQRFARHKNASTTLRYAKSKEAEELGETLKKHSY